MAANLATVSDARDIFLNMDYVEKLESGSLVKDWLALNPKFGFFINGEMKVPSERKSFSVKNPSDDACIALVLEPKENDIKEVVESAHEAFQSWSNVGETRARLLYRLARNIQKHQQLFSVVECTQTGKTINEVKNFDIPQIIRSFYYYAGHAQLRYTKSKARTEVPHAVTVVIPSWNFPAMQIAKMAAPALAAGNTVIVKDVTKTPLSAYFLAEMFRISGFPDGVFNVISGTEKSITEGLLRHNIVRKISFVGSFETGIEIRQMVAGREKHTSLELDGKCALIVFDNVDRDSLIEKIVFAAFSHNGQSNFAASRLLIQETIFEDVISKLKIRMNKLRIGKGLDKKMDFGSIFNENQLKIIKTHVETAKQNGAKVFQPLISTIPHGNYFLPTLITDINPGSVVATEEILGPVLVAFPFRTAKESIAMANNSAFGLAAGVFTENSALAMEVASSLKVGTVWINCYNVFDAAAPFGGCKLSGYGRHGGKEGLNEYLRPIGSWNENKCSYSFVEDEDVVYLPRITINTTYEMYIGGIHTRPVGKLSRKIFNRRDELVAVVGEGSRKDIRNVVEAAQKAQIGWAKRIAHNRAQILYDIAENLQFNCNYSYSFVEFEAAVRAIRHWAALYYTLGGKVNETISSYKTIQVNEPIGVIGISCPDSDFWPLLSFATLVAMAIAFGNTVVVIPNKTNPIPALNLIKVFEKSNVPAGVINIVTGDQDILAECLAQHHNINALWYFGGSDGCTKMEHASAENLKRNWIADLNSIDWIKGFITQDKYLCNAVSCKTIWLPIGKSLAN